MNKLTFFAVLPFSMMWKGYVLSVLWGWFAVTALYAPPLSVPAAIGITVMINFTTNKVGREAKDYYEFALIHAGRPAVALLIGWIIQFWM